MSYILAIDQGTTNSKAIIFDRSSQMIAQHEKQLTQYFPHDGWVEQDPQEMLTNTLECCRATLTKANIAANQIAAIGIANQRETTIIWNRETGKPIYHAIVWQDRRTTDICRHLAHQKIYQYIRKVTGLLLDPYFSATKIMWILDNVPHARQLAEEQKLLFGTVDTFLLWKLTNGQSHATDITNASRTLLFNIETQQWDKHILQTLNIPESLLPNVKDNTANFGHVAEEFFGTSIPIAGMAGDQQAATIGQACFTPGDIKATYGTGCFMLLNTGETLTHSSNQLISTIAYRINGKISYGLEGSIFSAGETIKWLRDTLKIIERAEDTEAIANKIPDTDGVYLVPAFTGLGAPYWEPEARAAILGLTRNSNRDHIVRAALECVAYQTRDLLGSMLVDYKVGFETLRVDGGMTTNNWLLQFLSDMLDSNIERPHCIETTALGAAYLAGLQVGIYQTLEEITNMWKMHKRFQPLMSKYQREYLYQGWKQAVQCVIKNKI